MRLKIHAFPVAASVVILLLIVKSLTSAVRKRRSGELLLRAEGWMPHGDDEFDAAFLRLQERCEPLSKDAYHDLTDEEREALTLLEDDNETLKRRDQEVLREHDLSRGIDLGREAYLKRAPVVYMTRLLISQGYTSLEAVYREYPQLKNGAVSYK